MPTAIDPTKIARLDEVEQKVHDLADYRTAEQARVYAAAIRQLIVLVPEVTSHGQTQAELLRFPVATYEKLQREAMAFAAKSPTGSGLTVHQERSCDFRGEYSVGRRRW